MRDLDENYPGVRSPDPESDYWYEPVDRKFLSGEIDNLSFRIWSIQHVAARIEEHLGIIGRNDWVENERSALGFFLVLILGALLMILWRVW